MEIYECSDGIFDFTELPKNSVRGKWYLKKIDNDVYVYHKFDFNPDIKNKFYVGNEFIGFKYSENVDDIDDLMDRIITAGKEGFMPKLVKELKSLIGKKNYVYDGYEFGPNIFSHYFFIKRNCYKEILDKIDKWKKYNDFDELMSWKEKEI